MLILFLLGLNRLVFFLLDLNGLFFLLDLIRLIFLPDLYWFIIFLLRLG